MDSMNMASGTSTMVMSPTMASMTGLATSTGTAAASMGMGGMGGMGGGSACKISVSPLLSHPWVMHLKLTGPLPVCRCFGIGTRLILASSLEHGMSLPRACLQDPASV